MPPELNFKQSAKIALAISAAFPVAAHAAAGKVEFAVGDVAALRADGSRRALAKGAEIATGETIDTGSGRAQVRFADGAQVSLQPQTQFRVDEYRFNGKPDGEEKGFFSLLKGGLRTITGLVGRNNRDAYKITTQVATIGIRGTEYSASLGNGLTLTTGEGSVEVCNAAGCMILNSGDSGYVATSSSSPTRTENKTSLPPESTSNAGAQKGQAKIEEKALQDVINQLTLGLPSGPGYAMAMTFAYDGGEYHGGYTPGVGEYPPHGTATFTGGALTSYVASLIDGGESGVNISGTGAMLNDGLIGWGRLTSGSLEDAWGATPLHVLHYVIGKPTPDPTLTAFETGQAVGRYSLLGYTFPTLTDQSTGAVTTPGWSVSSSKFDIYFGLGKVDLAMKVGPYDLYTPGLSSYYRSGAAFEIDSVQYASDGCEGNCGAADVVGHFFGNSAERAGLAYQFYHDDGGEYYVNGAAAFSGGVASLTAMPGVPLLLVGTTDSSDISPGALDGGELGILARGGSVAVFDGSYTKVLGSGEHSGDEIISWGRWTSGVVTDGYEFSETIQAIHYVTGALTPSGDLVNLHDNNMIGTYSFLGATTPTYANGSNFSGAVSGILAVDFGAGTLDLGLNVGNYAATKTALGWGGGSTFNGAFDSVTYSGAPCASGCSGSFSGAFFGANAARAGVAYQLLDDTTTISGAAAFKQTSLAPAPP